MAIEVQKPQVDEASVRYQSLGVLADIANQIADTRRQNTPQADIVIRKGAKIRYWLKALDYEGYLTFTQRQQILYKLIQIAGIYNFPTAPVLGARTRPSILVGEQGPPGPVGPSGGSGGTAFANTDVDTGTETVDTFAYGLGTGAIWQYVIRNASNTASRKGTISATWLTDGSSVSSGDDFSTAEIGDTSGVQLTVDISGSNVRLLATASSDNWLVEGERITIG